MYFKCNIIEFEDVCKNCKKKLPTKKSLKHDSRNIYICILKN